MEDIRKTQKDLPIYPHSNIYAQEHGELDNYFASQKVNIACKNAIEEVISAAYHDNRLNSKDAVQEVFSQFGIDRTLYILAATVQQKDWDGRFSTQNKQWAKMIPVSEDIDKWGRNRTAEYVVDSVHPGLTNLFLNQAKLEAVQIQESNSGREQQDKPSIKNQLTSHASPKHKPAEKSKDREVR